YRASIVTPDDFAQVNGEISVQPIAATEPDVVASDSVLTTAAKDDYQMVDHFYADHTDEQGDFLYRVAPRDALGQIRQWPADNGQFSAAVEVTTYDFMPPHAPQNPQAIVNETHTQASLTWEMPDPPADLDGFRIERTFVITGNLPTESCNDFANCWVEVAVVDENTFEWLDTDGTLDQNRWYRIQAVDESGNRSMYTMPVNAILHDIEPPSKPDLRVRPCDKDPNDLVPEYCIEGGGDSDVTRYLVGCTFWPDSDEIYLIELEAEVGGGLASYLITDLYDPPFDLDDVACTVRAVDEMGNISEPSDPAVIDQWAAEEPPVLPNPIISDITTVSLTELGNATAEIEWEMPHSPLIGSFRIDRDLLSGEFNVPAVINGIDGSARSYLDSDINAGELYSYTVTAELKFGLGELSSQPRLHRVVSDGRRPLARFDLTNINWTAANGTELLWNSCDPDGGAIDGIRYYAIYRSINASDSYNQITPIFPASACVSSYIDDSAQHGRYFYSVMEFDGRTGEPVGYTIPVQFDANNTIQTDDNVVVNPGEGLIQNTIYALNPQIFLPNCTPIDPSGNDFGQPLLFGDGFEVHNLVVNVAGNNISGTGDLRVNNGGAIVNIPVTLTNITVNDAQNHVCTGFVNVDVVSALGVSILVTPATGFNYEVLTLSVRPFYANISNGSGRIRVQMPRTIRVLDANGSGADMLNLAGPQLAINADLDFTFQVPDISAISTHGCDGGDDPIVGFALETMPTIVVPDGQFTVTPDNISMAASCMDYNERYNPAYANGYTRPVAGTLTAGDSNDGFLRGRYTSNQGGTTITADGLAGTFNSSAPMAYVASYPFGFSVELNGAKTLTIATSNIMSGSLGAGNAAFLYHQTVADTTQTKMTVNFNELTVDANGGLYASVMSTDPVAVEWMLPNGFVAGLLNSELYVGQVTTDQRPGQIIDQIASSALWATRPSDTVDLGLENPAELEPGLNVRRDDHGLFWKQCPSGAVAGMDAIVDTYVRHGGVSERFQAQLASPVTVNVHGYEVEIDNFDISFLDNLDYDSNITGDLMLPFPADLDLRFISMWFGTDGCVGGGELLNGYENLAYWNTNVNLNHAVFADEGNLPALPGYPHWDRVLRTLGALELPHVSLPNQPAPALIGVGIGFQPDGNPYDDGDPMTPGGIVLAPERPNFEFDGFPLLLTGMSLSQLNDAASWDSDATAATPPNTDWSQKGYVEINGAIAAPYFGLLVRSTGNPGDYPEIRMQLHDDYVGFDEQLKGARVWVDLPIVQVYHEFRNLVYASSAVEGQGLLLGFREYEFIPQVAIDTLGLPQDAMVIHMDASVIMEPQNVHFFLGQSSGTAAFRAMTEAIDGENPPLPGNIAMNLWAAQLNMSNDARDGYIDLAAEVWPYYNGFMDTSFRSTTQALNAYEVVPEQDLPNSDEFGGGTLGFLENVLDLNKMRGHVEVDGIGAGMQLEELQVALEFVLRDPDEPKPVIYMEMASLNITRYGIYVIEVVQGDLNFLSERLSVNATVLYTPETQVWEIGVGLYEEIGVLHEFESWNIVIEDLTGAGIIGSEHRYVGVNLEASWNFYPFKSGAFGGQMVIGTIDPDSPVLNAHFPDVMEHLHLVPAEPGSDTSTE
ncbi:MAG: fibronectin type III domain-containing protein, partial [Anaerolineales bacterium]|nr:fibronectin type III domain-containing protein [Anaerolineales bacterium]